MCYDQHEQAASTEYTDTKGYGPHSINCLCHSWLHLVSCVYKTVQGCWSPSLPQSSVLRKVAGDWSLAAGQRGVNHCSVAEVEDADQQ